MFGRTQKKAENYWFSAFFVCVCRGDHTGFMRGLRVKPTMTAHKTVLCTV
jgi:hypothetical protein